MDNKSSIFTQEMKKIALILAATVCLSATHAAPKEEKIDTLRTYELQNVEVLSTRAGRKTPVAYTTMDKKQIQKLNHGHDIPFLLSLTPGVTTTSDAGNGIGYTSIKVRGTDPSRINITANGIPINDAESSQRSEEHTSELQSRQYLVCRLLLEKKN